MIVFIQNNELKNRFWKKYLPIIFVSLFVLGCPWGRPWGAFSPRLTKFRPRPFQDPLDPWTLGTLGPMGPLDPWALGPMGPWTHGPPRDPIGHLDHNMFLLLKRERGHLSTTVYIIHIYNIYKYILYTYIRSHLVLAIRLERDHFSSTVHTTYICNIYIYIYIYISTMYIYSITSCSRHQAGAWSPLHHCLYHM